MNKILKITRSLVKFNADDPIHRMWYFEFKKTKSWAKCPVRFAIENNFVDVPSCIESKLLNYYMHKDNFKGLNNE